MNALAAHGLARALMDAHGLGEWLFTFDRAVRRFGSCRYRFKTITLSRRLAEMNPEETVRNVMLHEIAHALAGPRAGHGPAWRETARRIGCDARRCYDSAPGTRSPEAPHRGVCPRCGAEARTFRRRAVACARCCDRHNGGRFSERYLFRWESV